MWLSGSPSDIKLYQPGHGQCRGVWGLGLRIELPHLPLAIVKDLFTKFRSSSIYFILPDYFVGQIEMAADFPGYKYVGCFADSEMRLLDGAVAIDDSGMSRGECVSYCNSISIGRFYPLIGLEDANECFCGTTYTRDHGVANENGCDQTCPGNKNQSCGGNGYINVYSATVTPSGITPLPTSSPTMAASFTTTVAKATVTTTTGPTFTPTSAHSKSASHGALAGVSAIAGVLGLALIALIVLWFLRSRKPQHERIPADGQLPVFQDPNVPTAYDPKYGQRPLSEMPNTPRTPVYELNNSDSSRYEPLR